MIDSMYFDYDRINRLQSTLINRLNLINSYEKSINKNYIPMTIKNIGINIDNEYDIINFMEQNNKHIEKLKNWFNKNGSSYQKCRLLKKLKN